MNTKHQDLVDKIAGLPPEQAKESIKVYLSLGDIDACELMADYCDGQELLCWAIATKRKSNDLGFIDDFSSPLSDRLKAESKIVDSSLAQIISESFYDELVMLNPYPKKQKKSQK